MDPLSDCEAIPLTSTITRKKRHRAGTVRVSLLAPDQLRTYWWWLGRCAECGRPHLGRSRDLEHVTRERRLPCGHWVTIVVARTYRQDALFSRTYAQDQRAA